MSYTYTVVDGKYVVEKLGKGETVLCVDFPTMRVFDCGDLTVNAIISFVEKDGTVFYTKTEVTSE